MLIAGYIFLGIEAAVSCMIALKWLGIQRRRRVVLSFIAGMICGSVFCLNMSVRASYLACQAFLILYLPIVIYPQERMMDENAVMGATAAVSVACALNGMFQVTSSTLLEIKGISLFFRITLTILCLTGVFLFCRTLSGNFPGNGWQEYFRMEEEGGEKTGKATAVYYLFPIFGFALSLSAVSGIYRVSVMLLEWFAFFAGLHMLDLIIVNRKERLNVLTEKQYRDEMQTYMSVIRSQRHDYNFHVQTLHGLILRKDYDACEKYLGELLGDSINMNALLPLKDAAVGALILSFQNRARQRGIPMEIVIENDLSQIATNVYETNKVIGNLLQNAIDETEMLSDKSYGVKLSILKRGEFCIINVSNRTRSWDPAQAYQMGVSSKTGHEGVGVASIQSLAAKYGGVVYSRLEEDIRFFIAKIPLSLIKGAG